MAYIVSNTIAAADLNGFLTTARNVYGTGTGDRGYGQTAVTQADVSAAGPLISSAHWTNLRSMIVTCANHQGTAQTLLPPSGEFAVAELIEAHESSAPTSDAYDLDTVVTAIDTNRLNAPPGGSMTLTSSAHTVTRGSSWSTTISAIVDATWASEDAARYFFNAGGEVRLRLTQPGGTSQDTNWATVFSTALGTLTFRMHATSRSGSGGTPSGSIGFYELTGTDQLIFNGTNIGTGAYSSNDVLIYARRLNYVGTNGGNGNGVRFTVTLQDEHTNGFFDTVASGTQLIFDHYRATTHLTGIAAPSYATNTPF